MNVNDSLKRCVSSENYCFFFISNLMLVQNGTIVYSENSGWLMIIYKANISSETLIIFEKGIFIPEEVMIVWNG